MKTYFDSKFNKKIIYLIPGDYSVTEDDVILQTILGSCVSVCLYSDFHDLVGMNHFLLPDKIDSDNFEKTNEGRYGMFAMEILINLFLKKGLKKNNLKAKVFGGGNVLDFERRQDGIASNNIKFIINFLDQEHIPIISSHLGGNKARKILFFSRSKKVLLKEISESETRKTMKEEVKYQNKIKKEKSSIILFE